MADHDVHRWTTPEPAVPELAVPEPAVTEPAADAREGDARVGALRGMGGLRRGRLPWLAAALLVAVVAGVLVLRALPVRATAVAVQRRDVVRTLVLTGRVRPPARARLGVSLAGAVREVRVREGDHVTPAQLLVRLDDAPQAAALAQARAALAAAEARARATADQAGLAARQAERDLARTRALYAQGAISARELEQADRAARVARSELEVARARAGASASLAEVARARATVAAAAAQLALTRLTAPAAGTVLVRSVEPGDVVTPGRVLLELALDGPTELVAFPREENLADLRPGAPAIVSADAFPESTFAARVTRVAPVVDPAQGTVEVRLAVPAPPAYLRADMTVSIDLEVARRARTLVVPRELVHDADGPASWVAVLRDGRAVRRPVRLGLRGDGVVEILGGLAEGERVLPADVAPGRRVRER